MAVCATCQTDNPDTARFCTACGSSLSIACTSCETALPPGAKFCPACGASVVTLRQRGEERKIVTVLFADLVGFTGRAEQLDPEDVRATLSPYAARLRVELERFGGTVEKFVGDAVMALFGAPVAREDDPERAVRAALAIRDAVAEMNESGLPIELHVRIAVNTGEALVALDARPEEGEGMAAGDVVNTASRLQSAAPVDGILVGEPTYRATRETISYREAEPVRAKGKAEPITVWEAVGERSGLDVELEQLPRVPLVGRADELAQLRESLARTRRERSPQLVTLVGVPGIGKSRLVAELASAVAADDEPVHWLQGRSLPYGDGVTFWAIGEMAKGEAGILHSDGAETAEMKLRDAVRAALPDRDEARWVESHLRPLVGLDTERGTGSREDAFVAWRRFFEALADRSALVLVFEDLHWADEALLDFVDELVDRAVGVPLLVLATARPDLFERRPDWGGGKRNAATASLSPLTDDDTARLLGELLERAVLPVETQEELLALVGGVPLCAEEYVRMLEDRGLLHKGRLSGAPLPLPETVQGIIAARLDALAPTEKAMVQDAAVIGRSFWIGALQAIGGEEARELENRLHGLERKELVRRERRSSVASESQYVFWHVLVRDVAYGQIPRAARAEKHRLAAEWIERLGADRADDRSEMLAHHYLCALDFARAAGQPTVELSRRARLALREAGDRATVLHAFRAAARFYAAAVDLWPDDDLAGHELRLRYGRALIRSEGRGAEIVEQARDALLAAGAHEAAAEADVILADVAWTEGRRDDTLAGLLRAMALLDGAPVSAAKGYAWSRYAGFLMADGQEEEAIRVGAQALEMTETLGLDDLSANTLASVGVARTSLGDPGGLDDLARSLEVALGSGSPGIARSHFNLGSIYANLGDLARASEHYARGAEAARRSGEPSVVRWFEAEALYERYWRGDWTGALAAADDLVATIEVDSGNWALLDSALVRSAILLARGDVEEAGAEADSALRFARAVEAPQALLPALPAAARAALAADDAERARALLRELLDAWPGSGILSGYWVAELAVLAAALDEHDAFAEAAGGVRAQTRWLDAASAFVRGEHSAAADVYAAIGSLPDEAYARLCAAQALLDTDNRTEADGELRRALAFHRAAGARLYVREAEALLPASA